MAHPPTEGERTPLTRERWATEALRAMAAGGIHAVAVEPLAKRLGVTKGSFYWHFKSRESLLEAALERLEHNNAAAIADFEERFPDPRARLRALFLAAFEPSALGALLLHLASQQGHPVIAPVIERVTEARLDYLQRIFVEIGIAPSEARHHAMLSYSAYLGHYQIAASAPGRAPGRTDLAAYASYIVDVLVP
jgi:AcrR family transcriptional regulator